MEQHFRKDMSNLTWDEVLARQARRAPLMSAWFAAMNIKAGSHVVDIGSGPGFTSLAMAEIVGPTGLVSAVDRSADALAVLERLQKARSIANIRRFVADACELPNLGLSVEAAALTMVLHHADDPLGVMTAIAATLPQGAPCVIAEFHPDGPCTSGPPKEARLPPDQLVAWGTTSGMRVAQTVRQSDEHYMMVLTRP